MSVPHHASGTSLRSTTRNLTAAGMPSAYKHTASSMSSRYEPTATSMTRGYEPTASSMSSRYEPTASSMSHRYGPTACSMSHRYGHTASSMSHNYDPTASSMYEPTGANYYEATGVGMPHTGMSTADLFGAGGSPYYAPTSSHFRDIGSTSSRYPFSFEAHMREHNNKMAHSEASFPQPLNPSARTASAYGQYWE